MYICIIIYFCIYKICYDKNENVGYNFINNCIKYIVSVGVYLGLE